MPAVGWTPGVVPYGADETVYIVVDRFCTNGAVFGENEAERSDFETVVNDFLTGQFNDPVRVVAFNTLEHWSTDVSGEIAAEIQFRCDIDCAEIPSHASDFVMRHLRPNRQSKSLPRLKPLSSG